MNLTQRQIETIKVLAEFDDIAQNTYAKDIPWVGFSDNSEALEYISYLTDLNKLAEILRKLRNYTNTRDDELRLGWWFAMHGGQYTESFALTLAQIITELKLNDKEK